MNQLSLDQVINAALQSFSEELAKTEIQIYQTRNSWKAECKMTAYFQSTQEKAIFSRLMYLAACVKQPYTISEISSELGISRQAIKSILDDCFAEGWVVREKVNSNSYKYKAAPILCDGILAYADYASDLFLKGDVYDTEHFLRIVKRRKAALRCQD